jgi:hypothetical protein
MMVEVISPTYLEVLHFYPMNLRDTLLHTTKDPYFLDALRYVPYTYASILVASLKLGLNFPIGLSLRRYPPTLHHMRNASAT